MRLKDKVAIITGGGSGIGRAAAILFAKEGSKVVIADIDEQAGIETSELIKKSSGECTFIMTDVSKNDNVAKLVEEALRLYGTIDVLFNNAGINITGTVLDTDESQYEKMMDVNVRGVYLCCKHVIPNMVGQGSGSVINVSSIGGFIGFKANAVYNATKGAVLNMTKGLAIDFAQHNIRVNAICPGPIDTPLLRKWLQKQEDPKTAAQTPLGRIGTPEDVAYAALFLASDESSFITGTAIVVDGGVTAS